MNRRGMLAPVLFVSTAVMVTAVSASVAVLSAGENGAVTLRVPDRANATPWIAASGDFVAVAWGASAAAKMADVYVAVSRDGGLTFAAPVQVNTIAGEGRLGGELPPRVSLARRSGSADPEIVVLWNARRTVTSIKMSKSRDGGKSFAAPVTLSSSDAAGDRGWPSLTVDGHGTSHAIWVDHRGLAAARREGATHTHGAGHGGDRATHDGVAMAQKSGLYFASLPVSGGNAVVEHELTAGTCYCCKTALVTGRDDVLYAAWRHVYPGNFRDIAFSVSRDRGRTFSAPVRVSEDGWEIHGCPDDGPAMTVDKRGVVHVIWPTVIGGGTDEPQGALFYASTSDGRTFTPRVRIPTLGSPKPGHPQIVADDRGRVAVAWDEVIDGQRIAVVREVHQSTSGRPVTFGDPLRLTTNSTNITNATDASVATSPATGSAASVASDASTYPILASTSRGLLAVWTSGTSGATVIAVKQIDLRSPTTTASR
jgi:hypothetical protein